MIPTTAAELTPEWLSDVLDAPITGVRTTKVGTGQMGVCVRIHLEHDRDDVPSTLVAKLPSPDLGARAMVAGSYVAELSFYTQLADTLDVDVPGCHHAEINPESGDFVLLLDDLAPATQGDQVAGCHPDQVRTAALNLAGLHGPSWCDERLLDVGHLELTDAAAAGALGELCAPTMELFIAQLGDLLPAEDAQTLRECAPVYESWVLASPERFAIVHGDYRLDNLMFTPDGSRAVAVDWQTYSLALPGRDLAYLVSTSLTPEQRRGCERDVVAAYYAKLAGYDVGDFSEQDCWDDYVTGQLQGPLVASFGCAYGRQTERGDVMFATMMRRSCAAIRELGALDSR